nr:OB-fold domain-containing protein [Pseudarthrobacter sulfonivorans]
MLCAHVWLPPRHRCPECLGQDYAWELASGAASLISWVTYHRSTIPEFSDKVPYNVSIVELVEGPRLISRVVNWRAVNLALGLPLQLQIDPQDGEPITEFIAPAGLRKER